MRAAAPYIKYVDGERIAVFPLPPITRAALEVWRRRVGHRLDRIERALAARGDGRTVVRDLQPTLDGPAIDAWARALLAGIDRR